MPHPRGDEPEKYCEYCGIRLHRKVTNGRMEDLGVFRRRKYCSLTCANSKKDGLTKHGYSWRARKHLKSVCEACGAVTSLIAHHIDQNKANNAPENIQTLCKHCHDFWHATQKRRGWSTAGRMPKLFDTGNQE
jgi:5-methylcytosine-specific restriction endonuclease McrA